MKLKLIGALITIAIVSSCASIPKETVELSKVLGNDLKVLHNSHRTMVELYYNEITDEINVFIDSPFIIYYVLKAELKKHQEQKQSIYGTIEEAGKNGGKKETDNALNIMTEFLEDANTQVEKKRKELLDPMIKQRTRVLRKINDSYVNTIYANSTITGYLESIRKVKESQQEALSIIGLEGKDEELNKILLQTSELTKLAITKGKEIDIKSDEAYSKIEEISNQIKSVTNKN
jgi:hypothetical protein